MYSQYLDTPDEVIRETNSHLSDATAPIPRSDITGLRLVSNPMLVADANSLAFSIVPWFASNLPQIPKE